MPARSNKSDPSSPSAMPQNQRVRLSRSRLIVSSSSQIPFSAGRRSSARRGGGRAPSSARAPRASRAPGASSALNAAEPEKKKKLGASEHASASKAGMAAAVVQNPSASSDQKKRRGRPPKTPEQQEQPLKKKMRTNPPSPTLEEAKTPEKAKKTKHDTTPLGKKSSMLVGDMPRHVLNGRELTELLGKLPAPHFNERQTIHANLTKSHATWRSLLLSGFSVVLYGFGSKRRAAEEFAQTETERGVDVVVLDGHHPQANVHAAATEVLAAARATNGITTSRRGENAATTASEVAAAMARFNKDDPKHVLLVVHGIDAQAMRTRDNMHALAALCDARPYVRVVASADHVHAAAAMDAHLTQALDAAWVEAHTYEPYEAEAALSGGVPPVLRKHAGDAPALHAATVVLRTLTPNARDIFGVLARAGPSGMTQSELYAACRDRFLVSAELTLRAHLQEFRDHELVIAVRDAASGVEKVAAKLQGSALNELLATVVEEV
ncbi:Origin recognition complex subunit 2 [Pycnococcus provasolii]|uniref:Origin recognition complex subunit 2 n=1 Tax=Pycnococcus provasolii TaxID=41880 RepID=A0A830HWS3_9CHLO|nr:Origin recognition complex subunit 2 [Pycnococcus provasolii]